jgi:regulator of protease activity HflC (stomatin/prohibitin superfamily)
MKSLVKTMSLIKNLPLLKWDKDFRFNIICTFIFILFLAAGVFLHFYLTSYISDDEILYIVYTCLGALFAVGLLTAFPLWSLIIKLISVLWICFLLILAFLDLNFLPLFACLSAGLMLSPCIQLAKHWEKTLILRHGKFRRLKGPGLFLIMPLVERASDFVDTRIRATDFSAETTLTKDTVPVHVDAIAFWMIWDAKKAILEVENFLDAVILSAQTALRDAIGKHDLATLLSERDRLGKEIQQILEAKTNPWGITILSIEIRDIIIPRELEDAMSKQAQAERERQSRVILGTAEIEISEKFRKAAQAYKDDPNALHLRAMNIIYEGLRKNGSIILLPSSAIESMSLGAVLGTTAMDSVNKLKQAKTSKDTPEISNSKEESHDKG